MRRIFGLILSTKDEKRFKEFLDEYCKTKDYNFDAYIDSLETEYGNTGHMEYELSEFESVSGNPELFDYELLEPTTYPELKAKHQEEVDDFPMYWAFGDDQWKKLLDRFNLTEEEAKEKLIRGPAGSIMFKEDYEAFKNMINTHNEEIEEQIDFDVDGTGFVKSMFLYEMANHEYGYTRDLTDTLDALNITQKDFEERPQLKLGLDLAKEEYLKHENEEEDCL